MKPNTASLLLLFSLLPRPGLAAHAGEEGRCQQQFVQWMLMAQARFSNGDASVEARREAERQIDRARQRYDDSGSFCAALAQTGQPADPVTSLAARFGEVQSFHRQR